MGEGVDCPDDVRRRTALSEVREVVPVGAGIFDDVVEDRNHPMHVVAEAAHDPQWMEDVGRPGLVDLIGVRLLGDCDRLVNR
jgi:hypothetical protein